MFIVWVQKYLYQNIVQYPNELKQDPLTQNNTYFITLNKDYDKLVKLKEFAKELNKKLQINF